MEKGKLFKENFNPHPSCKGHGIFMIDCSYDDPEDRKLMMKVLSNYIEEE